MDRHSIVGHFQPIEPYVIASRITFMNDRVTTNESSDEIDLTDRQIGDYRLLRRLGRGGMADVYLAEQMSLKRNVALKVLKSELAKD